MDVDNDVGGGDNESGGPDKPDRPDSSGPQHEHGENVGNHDHYGHDTERAERATGGDSFSGFRDGDFSKERGDEKSGSDGAFGLRDRSDQHDFHLLDSKSSSGDERFSLGDFDFEKELGKGERATGWSSGDSNDLKSGSENFGQGFLDGLSDLWGRYQDMVKANTIGADEYFHCLGHCESTQRGAGGAAASSLVGYGREIMDFPKNIAKGMSPSESFADCAKDLERNRVGHEAAQRGERCVDACRPFKPRGL